MQKRACRWETFESHHNHRSQGKAGTVQPFVRSLRIFVSASTRHVSLLSIRGGLFYQRQSWGALSRPVLLPLLLLLLVRLPQAKSSSS